MNAYEYIDQTNTYRLSDLLVKLNNFKELNRIRYTTSHPKDVTKDLIQAHKSCDKLMPILHLPVQSGSSKILNAMNRKHSILEYHEIIEELKRVKPDIRFSSDFIIGYPGETEDDFNQTLDLIERVQFINSYSFIYSPRPGTPAPKKDTINPDVSKKRLIRLQAALEENNSKYKNEFFIFKRSFLLSNCLRDLSNIYSWPTGYS